MSLLTTLARIEAVHAGKAQPLATVRHRYLSERPLVLVLFTTAGEAGAPLGALVGTERDAPRLLAVPQPRDRDLRFAFLAELADVMLPYIEQYGEEDGGEGGGEGEEPCSDAPQILVPNAPGVEYVRLLGRSMRFRRTAEQDPETPYPAPPRVPLLGRWLTHVGERARVPGASLLLPMTHLLGRHWATGQSRLEDQHLGALLAWIDPPPGTTGAAAALRAETERGPDGLLRHPPAGPATDPVFDNKRLAPAASRHDLARTAAQRSAAEEEIRELLASQLRPTWDAMWRGIDLLRALPEGARVADRWRRDRWSYTAHRDRIRAGEPPQPRRDDAVTAARKLAARESALAQLDAQEALDDPLVMAERRLAGEAFAGEVTEVVMEYSEAKVPRPRPLVTVRTEDAPHLAEGVKLYRALPDGRAQAGEFVSYGPDGAPTVRLTGGMGRGKVPEPGSVPEKGDRVCWTLFEHAPRGGPELPDPERTPWTHGGPPGPAAPPDAPDPVTAEDRL
ncbi:hypothetical protein ACMATS_24065 [Streptoverticillium reticulum]|uniref:hypothetical protein n=1 Tax=Streptoverticillium reticulum TaxID=1433415 RepID=UPI0039BF43B3